MLLPQAFRVRLPALISQLVVVLKDTRSKKAVHADAPADQAAMTVGAGLGGTGGA